MCVRVVQPVNNFMYFQTHWHLNKCGRSTQITYSTWNSIERRRGRKRWSINTELIKSCHFITREITWWIEHREKPKTNASVSLVGIVCATLALHRFLFIYRLPEQTNKMRERSIATILSVFVRIFYVNPFVILSYSRLGCSQPEQRAAHLPHCV